MFTMTRVDKGTTASGKFPVQNKVIERCENGFHRPFNLKMAATRKNTGILLHYSFSVMGIGPINLTPASGDAPPMRQRHARPRHFFQTKFGVVAKFGVVGKLLSLFLCAGEDSARGFIGTSFPSPCAQWGVTVATALPLGYRVEPKPG